MPAYLIAQGPPISQLQDNFPGRPNNPVGFQNAPGFSGSIPTWPGGSTNDGTNAQSGSGTAIDPWIFTYDFTNGANIGASHVILRGCRFQSNQIIGNSVSIVNAQDVTFSYCSFTPFTSFYTSPPGSLWPSAGAGQNTNVFVDDVNCVARDKGYQFAITFTNNLDGPVTCDHCDFWGFGNAVHLISTTAQQTFRDCWFHDAANAVATALNPSGYHTDGIGYLDNGTPPQNILIDHCTIASIGTTNAIAFQAATTPFYVNCKVRRSFFSGFNVLLDLGHDTASTGMEFTDNVIGTDLAWTNGPLSGSAMFVSPGSPTNLWRRNKFRVSPGTTTIAGQQFSWTTADNGKFLLPDGTLSTSDYTG